MAVEVVARTINERGKYRVGIRGAPDTPHPRALQPYANEATGRLELSTFCVDGLDEPAKFALLALHGKVYGKTELAVALIEKFKLGIDPNWNPEKHVDIIGWPLDFDERHALSQAMSTQLVATKAA